MDGTNQSSTLNTTLRVSSSRSSANPNPNPNPKEENVTKKHFEKMDNKYNKLAINLREGKHHGVKWTVVPLCVVVGASVAINEQPWNWTCKRLG